MTPGCKGCSSRVPSYEGVACKARKREFSLTKARSEELRAAEADAWRKPASSTESPSSAKPCEQNTLTRHIFSFLHALISMSHVTLVQGVLRTSSMCHLHVVVLILSDPLLCTLHRLCHLPFHSLVLHLHLPCGLVR